MHLFLLYSTFAVWRNPKRRMDNGIRCHVDVRNGHVNTLRTLIYLHHPASLITHCHFEDVVVVVRANKINQLNYTI